MSYIKKNASFPVQSYELAVATQEVVARRLLQMSTTGINPSSNDHEEFHRMWIEKITVANESWSAMASEVMDYQQKLLDSYASYWMNPWSFFALPVHTHINHAHNAGNKVLEKGMEPIHRTAVENAKRLSKE